jgi:hypothetical protein
MHWKATTSSPLALGLLVSNLKHKARSTTDHIAQAEIVANNLECSKKIVFSGDLPSAFDACFRLMYSKLRYMCRGVWSVTPLYFSQEPWWRGLHKLWATFRRESWPCITAWGSSCMKSIWVQIVQQSFRMFEIYPSCSCCLNFRRPLGIKNYK